MEAGASAKLDSQAGEGAGGGSCEPYSAPHLGFRGGGPLGSRQALAAGVPCASDSAPHSGARKLSVNLELS